MASVVPFCAIRPTRDKVSLVATRSYLSYSDETLHEKLNNNPYTFLHIINPDFYEKNKAKDYTERFNMVRAKFEDLNNKGVFISDNKKKFYIYQKIKENGHSFIGIIGASSVEDYINGNIKIHEQTIEKREHLFKKYLDITGFNAEPVLLTYPNHKVIDKLIDAYSGKRAEYEFTTTNMSLHKLWLIDNDKDISTIQKAFREVDNLYIADGHHRFASSSLLYKDKNHINPSNKDFCMSYLIAENQLKIINFNRLVKDLNGLSKNEFLKAVEKKYTIQKVEKAFQPKEKDEIAMYLENQWYSMVAKDEFVERDDCVEKLDPSILSKNILSPILGITDPRNDKRLSFIDGSIDLKEIKNKIDGKEFDLAFILKAVNFNQLKDVADNGRSMPPKSTYIQPKLRSGMLIYNLND